MRCDASETPSQVLSVVNNRSGKRFKVPKTSFKGRNNGLDLVSVPRKLRSAMKKRNVETVCGLMQPSKKLDHTKTQVESPKKELKSLYVSITKDEEEVAETLFALAKMFDDKMNDSSCLKARASFLPEVKERRHGAVDRVTKEESSLFPEIAPSSSVQEQLPEPSTAKTEQNNQKALLQARNINVFPEPHLNSGRLEKISESETEPVAALEAKPVQSEVAQQKTTDFPTLWPGLYSSASRGLVRHDQSKASTTKIPAWMDPVIHRPSSSSSLNNDQSVPKLSGVINGTRRMKRCGLHVYITHLIRDIQIGKNNPAIVPCNRSRLHEGFEQKVPNRTAVNDRTWQNMGLNGNVAGGTAVNNSSDRNLIWYNAKDVIFHHEKADQNRTRGALTPKQSFDFLSLPVGSGRSGSMFASSSQNQFSYDPQYHHQTNTFINPRGAVAASHQAERHFLPHPSNPSFSATHNTDSLFIPNRYHHQQQKFWAAAQYRPSLNSIPLTQYPNFQIKKPIQTTRSTVTNPLYLNKFKPES